MFEEFQVFLATENAVESDALFWYRKLMDLLFVVRWF